VRPERALVALAGRIKSAHVVRVVVSQHDRKELIASRDPPVDRAEEVALLALAERSGGRPRMNRRPPTRYVEVGISGGSGGVSSGTAS
jgi:hypothetical protein